MTARNVDRIARLLRRTDQLNRQLHGSEHDDVKRHAKAVVKELGISENYVPPSLLPSWFGGTVGGVVQAKVGAGMQNEVNGAAKT